ACSRRDVWRRAIVRPSAWSGNGCEQGCSGLVEGLACAEPAWRCLLRLQVTTADPPRRTAGIGILASANGPTGGILPPARIDARVALQRNSRADSPMCGRYADVLSELDFTPRADLAGLAVDLAVVAQRFVLVGQCHAHALRQRKRHAEVVVGVFQARVEILARLDTIVAREKRGWAEIVTAPQRPAIGGIGEQGGDVVPVVRLEVFAAEAEVVRVIGKHRVVTMRIVQCGRALGVL